MRELADQRKKEKKETDKKVNQVSSSLPLYKIIEEKY